MEECLAKKLRRTNLNLYSFNFDARIQALPGHTKRLSPEPCVRCLLEWLTFIDMFKAMNTRRTILLFSLQLALCAGAVAQTAAPKSVNLPKPPMAPTNVIQPTVTMEMGDVGNKLFGKQPDAQATRRYYIAAEPQLWDYAPEGRDPICGKPLPPPVLQQPKGGKIRYIEYTDETFTVQVMETPRLGILGPVLRGVVGENLAVTFLNRTGRPLSMHPHGVKYDKDSEGSHYEPKPGLGAAVGPNAKFTYVWQLDEASGPQPGEPSSKAWLYHSHVNGDEESNQIGRAHV